MKVIGKVIVPFFLVSFFPSLLFGQNINVQYMIGENRTEVIKTYGKPVHQDNSNPEMICMFYQGDNYNIVFVGNKDGVYQANARVSYGSGKEARKAVDDFISKSTSNHFVTDTVTASDFQLKKRGVTVDLQLSKNEITKKYDLSVKARRTAY